MRTHRSNVTHAACKNVSWIVVLGSVGAKPLPGVRAGVDQAKDGCGIRDE